MQAELAELVKMHDDLEAMEHAGVEDVLMELYAVIKAMRARLKEKGR
jgi:hypothetical protein